MDCSQAPVSMKFSRQEYWSGLCFLLQGIFMTQGLNPHLLHCRQILYHCTTWKVPCQISIRLYGWERTKTESIPCSTENQRGPGLSLLCTVFSFSRLQFVLASVKSVQDICINIYTHIYIGEL